MKLQLVEVVRTYELTYLLPVSYTDSELNKLNEEVQATLKKQGAEIVSSEAWGKKRLAYRLKEGGAVHTEAFYTHVVFKAQSKKAPAIEKSVYLQPQILRHLLVVAESKASKEASTK